MPKIKTGLLAQCAMRNARGPSKGTKKGASLVEDPELNRLTYTS